MMTFKSKAIKLTKVSWQFTSYWFTFFFLCSGFPEGSSQASDLFDLLKRLTKHGMLPQGQKAEGSGQLPQAITPNSVELPNINLEDSDQLTRYVKCLSLHVLSLSLSPSLPSPPLNLLPCLLTSFHFRVLKLSTLVVFLAVVISLLSLFRPLGHIPWRWLCSTRASSVLRVAGDSLKIA